MNEEQIRVFIRASNAFLELYSNTEDSGKEADLLEPVVIPIMKIAKRLRIPHVVTDEGLIGEFIIPTKKQMDGILKRAKNIFGDAG